MRGKSETPLVVSAESRKNHCGCCYRSNTSAQLVVDTRMADYVANGVGAGTLKAICRVCATIMNRRVRWEAVSQILPDCEVQVRSVGHHYAHVSIPSQIVV